MSGDRFLCGVGPSGPQVVEGWHGVAYGKPMVRTKEYIDIIRQIRAAARRRWNFRGSTIEYPMTGPERPAWESR